MDQRAHDVEEDLKNILQTRLALADKIETLERRVQETVQTTKTAALDALDQAKNTAADWIESTTQQLNPSLQAGRRPWVMVGTAIAIGLLAGLAEQHRRGTRVYPYYPPRAGGADVMPERGQSDLPSGVHPFYGREAPRRSEGSRNPDASRSDRPMAGLLGPLRDMWNELTDELAQERSRLQNTALHAGRLFIQDVVRIAGQSLLDQLSRPGRKVEHMSGERRTLCE
jgi:ElaB/YqjD/DUF883 family membrane-anchored ribosome-binding protein